MYYYVISIALSTPMAICLIVSLIFRAYIIISFIYYVCIIAPALISHPFTNMHDRLQALFAKFTNHSRSLCNIYQDCCVHGCYAF